MIIIFSINQEVTTTEVTTTEVTRWLTLMNKKFIRINENEVFDIKTLLSESRK
jgi:hypothetical protein